MRRFATILLACLALLRPDAAVLAACHQAQPGSGTCCAAKCGCCEEAGDAERCCCSGEESPATPDDHAPAPTGSRQDLERALDLPATPLHWLTTSTPTVASSGSPRVRAEPRASGRALLRQACRLRH